MPDDTIETCPKHGLKFNRAHYFECEQCRGVHVSADEAQAQQLRAVWIARAQGVAALVACAFVLYLGVALTRTKPTPKRVYEAGPAVVGLPCARTCTERTDECFVDCASIREDACNAACMPQLEHCADRCDPRLRVRDGIAVITSGLPGPELDKVVQGIFQSWPPSELPDRAYVRLSIDRTTGKVRDAQVQVAPSSATSLVASTFQHADFPKGPVDPEAGQPGRRDAPPPYVAYLLMKP